MRLFDRWAGRWIDWPWRMLITTQFMLALLIVGLAGFWLVRAEQRVLRELRLGIGQRESMLAEHRRAAAALPPPALLAREIASLGRNLEHCTAQYDHPGQFIGAIAPGLPGSLSWRSLPPPGNAPAPGRWAVTATTDYSGLQKILQGMAALSGCWSLSSFEVMAHGGRLHVAFNLGASAEELMTDE